MDEIKKMISEITGVSPDDFANRTRKAEYVLSRQLYASALKECKGMTNYAIGFGIGRDPATIIHALKCVDNLCLTDKKFNEMHSKVLYKADLILNGEPVPREETMEEKELKTIIDGLDVQINNLRNEVMCLTNENRLLRNKLEREKLADCFNS